MAGIYIHIPFCKQACNYCDFHFATTLRQKNVMINALIKELNLRYLELQNETIETIYFGGGTPSLLQREDLLLILDSIQGLFKIADNPEITLEANPDDISKKSLSEWQELGVNRLSIGIQSFHEEDLKWMNRAHNATEASQCVKLANQAGITDISIDLIYGLPNSTLEKWNANINKALELGVPHISAYGLTIEPNTNFGYQQKVGQLKELNDEASNKQFELLIESLSKAGYEHYEISNFAKPNRYSKHNTAYWQEKKYLGIGPSAHSFDGKVRSWNIAHNLKYVKSIDSAILPSEKEELNITDKFNDYILTHLRTQWGINVERIKNEFEEWQIREFRAEVKLLLNEKLIEKTDFGYKLSQTGKMLADHVCMRLFSTI